MKRLSFKSKDCVYHLRLGLGACWIDVIDRGYKLAVNGVGIFEAQFDNGKRHSINGCWLQSGRWI